MYEYVNKMNVAANPEKNEIAIEFQQIFPEFCNERTDKNGNISIEAENRVETVSKLLLNYDFAKKLSEALKSILEQN